MTDENKEAESDGTSDEQNRELTRREEDEWREFYFRICAVPRLQSFLSFMLRILDNPDPKAKVQQMLDELEKPFPPSKNRPQGFEPMVAHRLTPEQQKWTKEQGEYGDLRWLPFRKW
jgi:hypothetical protein